MMQPLSSWPTSAWQSQLQQLQTPSCLQSWREQQLQEFLQRGFPDRREENWRYTGLAALLQQSFNPTPPLVADGFLNLDPYRIPNTQRLVFINGVFSRFHSVIDETADNILITRAHADLDNLTQHYQPQAESNSNLSQHLSVFHYLNAALMQDGLFIVVKPGAQISKPIHLLCVNAGHTAQGGMQHPQHRVELQEGSALTLLEEYIDLDEQSHFNNVVTRITLAANSRLNYYKLQRQSKFSFHIANTSVLQQRESQFKGYHVAQGTQLNREDLHIALQESGADCDLSGFYHPGAKQLIDFHTRIDHYHAHTRSCQYYKGMIEELGCGVFNGKIIVHPQAQKISAHQQNHNLLLAQSAEVNTKPELEVYADNVQCSHGATVGRIDPNALFYLRSRGLTESAAQQMLKIGFCQEIFDRLPDLDIANYIRSIQEIALDV